jgi:hypothetical protein
MKEKLIVLQAKILSPEFDQYVRRPLSEKPLY